MASPYALSNVRDELAVPPNPSARVEIWEKLFGRRPIEQSGVTPALDEHVSSPYFERLYKHELEQLRRGHQEENWRLVHLAVNTHQGILDLVDVLATNKDQKKSATISELEKKYTKATEKQISDSIDLAVRVRFMVNARDPSDHGFSPGLPLRWASDQTLREFLTEIFPKATWKPEGKESRLSPHFRAAYMVDVCGLRLEETSNLQEHLRLYRYDKANVLRYFPYKSCLSALDRSADTIIPREVLKETIMSLNLLFPVWDPATDDLLKNRGQKFHRDEPFRDSRTLNVLEYNIWRDRLLELYEEVFLSPPASWAQLYKDKRNPQQFWTFWIALVILALTIVSTIATIVQTVYAVFGYYK